MSELHGVLRTEVVEVILGKNDILCAYLNCKALPVRDLTENRGTRLNSHVRVREYLRPEYNMYLLQHLVKNLFVHLQGGKISAA